MTSKTRPAFRQAELSRRRRIHPAKRPLGRWRQVHGRRRTALGWAKGDAAFAQRRDRDGQWQKLYEDCRMISESGLYNAMQVLQPLMYTRSIRFLLSAIFLPLLGLLWLGPALASEPSPSGLPFPIGEKLLYQVRWGGIPAGHATLEVMPPSEEQGSPSLHFVMTARTNEFADLFYKYRNRIDSFAAPDLSRSLGFTKQEQERSRIRNEEVHFDWGKMKTWLTEGDGEPRHGVDLVPGTVDPLSVLYAFRIRTLETGKVLEVPVSDGKKLTHGTARVVDREEITVHGQVYDCFVVEPDLKDLGGVFRKSPGASMRIWVTADELRLPVRVRSKVVVGYFTADLIAVE